jgi:thymidine kinase
MFAGKTTELQRRVVAARALGQHVLVVKPARDTRYAAEAIVTQTGERVAANGALHRFLKTPIWDSRAQCTTP